MRWIVVVIVMAVAAPGTADAKPRKVPPMAALRAVTSAVAYCAELGKQPAVRLPDLDDPVQPGCVLDRGAWSSSPAAEAKGVGPFFSLRVLPITTARGAAACALFVELGDGWYVSEDAVTDCYNPAETWEDISGTFSAVERRAVIETSAGHDPCGCDDDLWVGHEDITVCGVAPGGEPVCTRPIETQHTGATNVMRTWGITNGRLELSAWWYGTHADAATATHERADADDGGGPARAYRLPF